MLKAFLLLGVAAQALALPTLASSNTTSSSTATPYVVPESGPANTAAVPDSATVTLTAPSPSLLAKAQEVAKELAGSLLDNLDDEGIAEYISHLTQKPKPVEKRGLGAALAGLVKVFSELTTGGASRKKSH